MFRLTPRTMTAQCIPIDLDRLQMQFWFETEGLLEAQGTFDCTDRPQHFCFRPMCSAPPLLACE